jgi:hypothetical protein
MTSIWAKIHSASRIKYGAEKPDSSTARAEINAWFAIGLTKERTDKETVE